MPDSPTSWIPPTLSATDTTTPIDSTDKTISSDESSWIPPNQTQKDSDLGKQDNIDQKNYRFQIKTNADNDLLRAQNQKWYEQIAKGVGNAVGNTVIGLLQAPGMIANIGSSDYTNDYMDALDKVHNPLGEIYKEHPNVAWDLTDFGWWAQQLQGLGEGAATLGLMFAGLGELNMGLVGAVGDALNLGEKAMTIARGAGQGLTAIEKGYVIGAQSGREIYKQAYQTQYNKAVGEGLDPDSATKKANDIAGKAATATVQSNMIFGTLLSLGEVASIFKEPTSEMKSFLAGKGAIQEGESLTNWSSRVKQMKLEDPEINELFNPRHGINSMLGETIKGGVEGLVMHEASQQGKRIGEGKETNNGIVDTVSNFINHFAGDAITPEGALQFVSMAAMAPTMALIADYVPLRSTNLNKDGKLQYDNQDGQLIPDPKTGGYKYKTERVGAKIYNERAARNYFDSVKEQLTDHIDKVDNLNLQLNKAQTSGDEIAADNVRNQLLAINAINGTQLGVEDTWKAAYKKIAEMDNKADVSEQMQPKIDDLSKSISDMKIQDPTADTSQQEQQLKELQDQQSQLKGKTAAMVAGYAKDSSDNEYKKRATDAIDTIEKVKHIYDSTQRKYGSKTDPNAQEVADTMFVRESQLLMDDKLIHKHEALIAAAAPENTHLLSTLDDVQSGLDTWYKTKPGLDARLQTIQDAKDEYNDAITNLHQAHNSKVTTEISKKEFLDKANKAIDKLAVRYGLTGSDETTVLKTAHEHITDVEKAHAEDYKNATEALANSTGFAKWHEVNPKKSLNDYMKDVASNDALDPYRGKLDAFKMEHAERVKEFNKLKLDKTRRDLYREAADRRKTATAKVTEDLKNQDAVTVYKDQQRKAISQMAVDEQQKVKSDTEKRMSDVNDKLKDALDRLNAAKEKLSSYTAIGKAKNLKKYLSDSSTVKGITKEINGLKAHLQLLTEDYNAIKEAATSAYNRNTKVQTKSPVEPVSYEDTPAPIVKPTTIEPVQETPIEANESPIVKEVETESTPSATDRLKSSMDDMNDDQIGTIDGLLSEYLDPAMSPDELRTTVKGLDRLQKEGIEDQLSTIREAAMEIRGIKTDADMANASIPEVPVVREELDPVEPIEEITGIQPSDQPEIINDAKGSDNGILPGLAVVKGAQVQDMSSAAFSNFTTVLSNPISLSEDVKGVKRNSKTEDTTTNKGNTIQVPEINHKYDITMEHKGIMPGDKLRFKIVDSPEEYDDHDYLSPIQRNDDKTQKIGKSKFSDYSINGKIRTDDTSQMFGHGEVRIEIIHEGTGKSIGYMKKNSFLHAKDGSGQYLHHDMSEDELNVASAENLNIRQYLSELYNSGNKEGLVTTCTARGNGFGMFAGEPKGNGGMKYKLLTAGKMLPDNLTIGMGIRADGEPFKVLRGNKLVATESIIEMGKAEELACAGVTVALVPVPGGKYAPVPLRSRPLTPVEKLSVEKAIEWFERSKANSIDAGSPDDKAIKDLQALGYDLTDKTGVGLRNFIKQYFTFTQPFNKTDVKIDPSKSSRMLLDIKNGLVQIGDTGTGNYNESGLTNGELHSDFKEALDKLLSSRLKTTNFTAPGIKGYNEEGKFKEIGIYSTNGDNGKEFYVTTKDHNSYNDYIKTFLSTAQWGGTKTDSGETVYRGNSQVFYDSTPLMRHIGGPDIDVKTEIPKDPNDLGMKPTVSTKSDILKRVKTGIKKGFTSETLPTRMTEHKIDGIIEPTEENLDNLRNIAKDTDGFKNMSNEEVISWLADKGWTKIPENVNPFLKPCE